MHWYSSRRSLIPTCHKPLATGAASAIPQSVARARSFPFLIHQCIDALVEVGRPCLVGVKDQEGNHQREEAGGFREGETQYSVGEELTCSIGPVSWSRSVVDLCVLRDGNGKILTS